MAADRLDMSVLSAERRRFLATMGRRLTPQALERREPQRRYPILLTVLAQSATDVLDEVVPLFDQAISAKFGQAERRMQHELAERGKSGEDRQVLLDELLAIVVDPQIADEEIGGLIRGERIGWDRLRAAIAQAKPRLPRDHGHLAALDSSYNYLRQFTPAVLSAVRFAGGTAATELLLAVDMLRELNATGRRKAFDEAPAGFVPAKWRGYLEEARKSGSATAYRHYWELCVLLGLRDDCVAETCTCRARAATPIRPPTCSPPTNGPRSVPSSAAWSANPPTRRGVGHGDRRAARRGRRAGGSAVRRGRPGARGRDRGSGDLAADSRRRARGGDFAQGRADRDAAVRADRVAYGLAVDQMRRAGRRIDDDVLAHISPAHSENINFFGAIEVDIDAELDQLGPTGYRPLRVRDTLF
ncbi:hypothetical protein [Saccharopolyspora sp. NPDC002376]